MNELTKVVSNKGPSRVLYPKKLEDATVLYICNNIL
jgi:hypothetical protein